MTRSRSSGTRRLVENRVEYRRHRAAGERQGAGHHLIQDHAEREQVGASVELVAERLLGRHVGDRAQHGTGTRQIRFDRAGLSLVPIRGGRRVELRHQLGQPEVEDLHLAGARHEDVRRLQVAMENPFCMGGDQSFGDLERQLQRRLERQRTQTDPPPERFALETFHDEKMLSLVLVDVVDGADVGVIQERPGASAAFESRDRDGVLRDGGGKELQRDRSSQSRVFRTVHDSHPAATQLLDDAVVTDRLTDHVVGNPSDGVPAIIAPKTRFRKASVP